MSVTDDERRHAVEFLRTANCSDVACADCQKVSAALFGKGCENALCNLDDCSDSKPWRRIADLIEPEQERTCIYVYDEESAAWRCSECGGLEPVGDHVRYCPDCGAKVVDE